MSADQREDAPDLVDDALGGLVGQQPGDLETGAHEMQRQQAFAANAPNDQIHLHDRGKSMFARVGQIVPVRPPFPTLGVQFVLLAFSLSWLYTAGAALVCAQRRKQSAGLEVAVDRSFAYRQTHALFQDRMVDRLSLHYAGRDDAVEPCELFLFDVRALAFLPKRVVVGLVGLLGVVDESRQNALVLLGAAVADERRVEYRRAAFLDVARTALRSGASRPVRTQVPVFATVVDAPVSGLVARPASPLDFSCHGSRRLADSSGDGLDRLVSFEPDLDCYPLIECQVFSHARSPLLKLWETPIVPQGLPE